jgi:Papain-like cysteine protease AvrRpt2
VANPTIVSGKLVNPGISNFGGFRVEAYYAIPAGGVEPAATRQTAEAGVDGGFRFELPEAGAWTGPLTLQVSGSSGLVLGSLKDLAPGEPLDALEIAVGEDIAPALVGASEDPALGTIARFSGRVIDSRGNPQRGGLLVVVWGVSPSNTDAHPIAVAETVTGGYFAGEWPSDVFSRAFGCVAGGSAIDIPLDGDRLPRRIILVVDQVPDGNPAPTSPPRAPSPEDLASQPEAFANDTQCCTTFTIPNRTIEEVVFQAVVRTTQPGIRGGGVRPPKDVPPKLADRFAQLAGFQPRMLDATIVGATQSQPSMLHSGPADREDELGAAFRRALRANAAVTMPAREAVALPTVAERAQAILASRDLTAQPPRLESSVLADLAREPGGIGPVRLLEAERTSMVRHLRNQFVGLAGLPAGRFELSLDRQANWDEVPYAYQATTIAHGHILTMKQVWRADGYSLGDLLYSLPLAPGQQKLVSILDWERQDEARRVAHRLTTEDVSAEVGHDRDIADIVRASLHEHMDASSRANTSAVGGGIGGFIGPVVFGAAGGTSTASSSAQQASSRDIAASALNTARDRTLQSASAVRGQRATVVQTARQGESVRAQTEAIANNNHCHALTIEYFEVLRHFQVSQELANVQECLFVPFSISAFTRSKALRWRHVLQDLTVYYGGSVVALRPMFDALERVYSAWTNVDFPLFRYADDVVRAIDGEFWLEISIPRPGDKADNTYDEPQWLPYADLLGNPPSIGDTFNRYLGVALPANRGEIWNTRIAPALARRLIDHLSVDLGQNGVGFVATTTDATLVTPFRQNASLLVTFRSTGALPYKTRDNVDQVRLRLDGIVMPPDVEVLVQSGTMRYRTDHLTKAFFDDYTIQNDLSVTDMVTIATPLDRLEKRNPRQTDERMARQLIDILNERVEYFHRLIWLTMDPNRRYMFLDGVLAPDAAGRSVASVVDNQVIGIVGNCLVLPVVPGLKLDPTYEFARRTPEDLTQHYATDPPPPMRVSMPTKGVFAEAVMGACNSCEKIDEKRFWHWEDAPIPDTPTAILPLSTASRRLKPPSVTPSDFPEALVRMQTVPSAPDPTGLSAALSLLGTKDLFRNLTGLALNQENAASALKGVMSAAQTFATQGAALAQQRFLAGQTDRNLDLIKQARDKKQISAEQAQKMTESMFRGAIGERRPDAAPVTDDKAVKRAMDRVSSSESGEMRITRPGGSVELKSGNRAVREGIDVEVDPKVAPLKQSTANVCWAAVGAMLASWRTRTSMTIEAVLDGLGGSWRAKFDADQPLSAADLRGFATALGLKEEGPQSYVVQGLARLLRANGPLWAITDDNFQNNKLAHARVVVAMRGDGTDDGTTVTLADPASGGFVSESFAKFAARLEAADPVSFGVGIYHY